MIERSWPVGAFTVTLSVSVPAPGTPLEVDLSWRPHRPDTLTRSMRRLYVKHRAKAIREIAAELVVLARAQGLVIEPDPVMLAARKGSTH